MFDTQTVLKTFPNNQGVMNSALLDNIPALIVICSGDQMVCDYANHYFYRFTEKDTSILGQPLFNVFSEVVGQPVEAIISHVYREGGVYTGNEVHVQLAQKGQLVDFWFNVLMQPLSNEANEVTGMLFHATDVSKFVKSKRQLEESEKRFEKLKGVLHGLALITEGNGRVKFASTSWSQFLGRIPEHLDDLRNKIHSFDLPIFEEILKGDADLQERHHSEVRIQIEGGYEWHSLKVEKLVDHSENPQYIITLNNVHWQRSIPGLINSLLLSEDSNSNKERELLYSIIDATDDVFVLFDTRLAYQLVNSRLEQVIGHRRETLLGVSMIEKFPDLKGGPFHQDLERSIKGHIVRTERFYSPLTKRWFQNNFYPIHNNVTNDVTGVVFVGRDITYLVEKEVRITEQNHELSKIKNVLTGLIDTSVELIVLVDKNLIIQMTNQKFEYFASRTKEELLGMHLLEVHPGYKGSIHNDALIRAIAGEMVHIDRRRSLAREDVYLDTYYVPQFNGNEVTGVLVMSRDITDIVKYKRELEQRNAALQRINKELNAFSYVASHDLQEPLRKIRTFIGMIPDEEKQLLSETSRDYFNRINQAAERMQGLINDLLSYAQIETSILGEVVDLNEILLAVKEEYDHFFTTGLAELSISKLPVLTGNKLQLMQLFTNLVGNSLKYAHKERKCHIEISCSTCDGIDDPNQNLFVITVKDNGIGFEEAHADKIFGLFQRLHGRNAYNGNGIGLAICRRIVENHGGRIEASATLGEGAIFTIQLPRK